jgi:hypothetical protein
VKQLLNISTHGSDLEIIAHDWQKAKDFCLQNGFDGYELYPVGGYDYETIPTRSLSAEYVIRSQREAGLFQGAETFWERLAIALAHVAQVDQHDAFEDPGIAHLFDWIAPEYLVFEFSYRDLAEWQDKINRQKRALVGVI